MKPKILSDFQICISVPLIYHTVHYISYLLVNYRTKTRSNVQKSMYTNSNIQNNKNSNIQNNVVLKLTNYIKKTDILAKYAKFILEKMLIQQTFTCSKSTIETLKKCMRYVQS